MKGILDLLARANLVELSEEERLTAEEASMPAVEENQATQESPRPPAEPLSASDLDVEEGKPFDTVFAEAGIVTVAFPAEKLLRLLDGLRAMDGATRKSAVLAMDAADDGWQIADSVTDAERKITALDNYKLHLAAQLRGGEQQAGARMADIRAGLEAATAAIRQQIAELEQLLERKITQSAQETTGIEADLRATRETVAREIRRVDAEIERLGEIPSHFTPAPAAQ